MADMGSVPTPEDSRSRLSFLLLVVLSACSREKIADNTTDAVVFVGKTAVRGVVSTGKLAVRGAAAGVRRLQEPTDEFPAGTIVCLDDDGNIYAAAEQISEGELACPAQL